MDWYFIREQIEYHWILPLRKIPIFNKRVYLPAQYLVQCQTFCFKNWQNWNWKAERILRKRKKIVQTCDQAHMGFVYVQTSNSNQRLQNYLIVMLQQLQVVLHVN